MRKLSFYYYYETLLSKNWRVRLQDSGLMVEYFVAIFIGILIRAQSHGCSFNHIYFMVFGKQALTVSRNIERTFRHFKSIQTRAMFIAPFWPDLWPIFYFIP